MEDVANFDGFLTKPLPIEEANTNTVIGVPTQNPQLGTLLSDVKITQSGQLVATSDDWNNFPAQHFSYSDADTIAVNGIDATKYFQKGDKLRIVQSTTKYLIVKQVTPSQIKVTATASFTYGGTSYGPFRLANEAISSIANSRLTIPSGYVFDTDWEYECVSDVEYISSSQVRLVGNDYQVGDKIKISYTGGVDKFFYVYSVGNGYISLTGGSTYTVTSGYIAFSRSRLALPIGHPINFPWTPSKTYESGSGISVTEETAYFRIESASLYIYHSLLISFTTQPVSITYTSPFPIVSNGWTLYITGGFGSISMGGESYKVQIDANPSTSDIYLGMENAVGATYFGGFEEINVAIKSS